MKDLLKQLGITSQELRDLLYVHDSTIRSWLHRGANMETGHAVYFLAMKSCVKTIPKGRLEELASNLEALHQEELQEKQQMTIRGLEIKLGKAELELAKLRQKEEKAFLRWHLSENMTAYLPEQYQDNEGTEDWLRWLGRKTRHELKKMLFLRKELEQKIAALKAKLDYWKNA